MVKPKPQVTSKAKMKAKQTNTSHSDKAPPLSMLSHAQNFSVDSTSGHCTAIIDDEPCDCEEYSEDNNGQSGVGKCRECGHGRSKHKGKPQPGKKVRGIVEGIVARKFGGLDKMSTFEDAEDEANKGLRPKSKSVTKKVRILIDWG